MTQVCYCIPRERVPFKSSIETNVQLSIIIVMILMIIIDALQIFFTIVRSLKFVRTEFENGT